MYYSKDDEPLKAVTEALQNDNSGGGQYQIGILKKPTGTSDVVNSGYQETASRRAKSTEVSSSRTAQMAAFRCKLVL